MEDRENPGTNGASGTDGASGADGADDQIRRTIGLIDTSARTTEDIVARLSPAQRALRDAAIQHFRSNRVKSYIATQTRHVNSALQIGDAIRFLFDEKGRTPENLPLEEIVAERKRVEKNIKWLEALVEELKHNLVQIREVEDAALDILDAQIEDD